MAGSNSYSRPSPLSVGMIRRPRRVIAMTGRGGDDGLLRGTNSRRVDVELGAVPLGAFADTVADACGGTLATTCGGCAFLGAGTPAFRFGLCSFVFGDFEGSKVVFGFDWLPFG